MDENSYDKKMNLYTLSKVACEKLSSILAAQYYSTNLNVVCVRIDEQVKSGLTKRFYPDSYKTIPDAVVLQPVFDFIIKNGKEATGRIYSSSSLKDNLYLYHLISNPDISYRTSNYKIELSEKNYKLNSMGEIYKKINNDFGCEISNYPLKSNQYDKLYNLIVDINKQNGLKYDISNNLVLFNGTLDIIDTLFPLIFKK